MGPLQAVQQILRMRDSVESRRDAAESAYKYLSRFTVATSLTDQKAPQIEVPHAVKKPTLKDG